MNRKGYMILAIIVAPASMLVSPSPAAAQVPVFDATNYSQNLIEAARALEQINNQVKSLQNEAAMLQNMARNLQRIDFPELEQLSGDLKQIGDLMGSGGAIDFKVSDVENQFRSMFPGPLDQALKSDERLAQAKARLAQALASFRHSMTIEAGVVSSIQEDASHLNELATRSQNVEGSLEAQQATNQLLALGTKQQLQLQELLADEFRSESLERARQAQSQADAQAATKRFLGSGTAYSSTRE